ncbi:hypothetical protein DK26_15130 [Bosea sp. WAO]|uniref:Nif11-like leader peptide family natural product precursor n=1 Tax=Bosea sp. WAO TaxID=406341 RepID=UPI000749374E|nr:Nif11-like leader peptide family natural product precursor [Bosea sp. WAO]KUL94339.1 hypothetical protein DK26_15130 [Bosea sp. WAO]
MSISEIDRFRAELKSDRALRAEAESYRAAKATSPEDVVAFAAARGYDFDAGELAEFDNHERSRELSEAELYAFSGNGVDSEPDEWPPATAEWVLDAGLSLAVFSFLPRDPGH